MDWIILGYIATGMLAGLGAGLFGISGGVITIPCLIFLFKFGCVPCPSVMQLAIGTSLAAMTFNAMMSTYFHNRRGVVMWYVVGYMSIGLTLGAIIGAKFAVLLPSNALKIIFGIFECLIGAYYFTISSARLSEDQPHKPKFMVLTSVGVLIGTISAMLGIGGGVLVVPTLTYFRVSIKRAIGTAAACSFLITIIGALSYIVFGWKDHANGSSFGFIYLPAFIPLTISALAFSPFGVKLAHNLPVRMLKKTFAVLLVIVGIVLLLS